MSIFASLLVPLFCFHLPSTRNNARKINASVPRIPRSETCRARRTVRSSVFRFAAKINAETDRRQVVDHFSPFRSRSWHCVNRYVKEEPRCCRSSSTLSIRYRGWPLLATNILLVMVSHSRSFVVNNPSAATGKHRYRYGAEDVAVCRRHHYDLFCYW